MNEKNWMIEQPVNNKYCSSIRFLLREFCWEYKKVLFLLSFLWLESSLPRNIRQFFRVAFFTFWARKVSSWNVLLLLLESSAFQNIRKFFLRKYKKNSVSRNISKVVLRKYKRFLQSVLFLFFELGSSFLKYKFFKKKLPFLKYKKSFFEKI